MALRAVGGFTPFSRAICRLRASVTEPTMWHPIARIKAP
jgi:hypothetical protein